MIKIPKRMQNTTYHIWNYNASNKNKYDHVTTSNVDIIFFENDYINILTSKLKPLFINNPNQLNHASLQRIKLLTRKIIKCESRDQSISPLSPTLHLWELLFKCGSSHKCLTYRSIGTNSWIMYSFYSSEKTNLHLGSPKEKAWVIRWFGYWLTIIINEFALSSVFIIN